MSGFPYFYWHDLDSRDMGLWITQLPPIIRAEERVQRLTVPGKAGHLTMTEGNDIYNGYVKNCVVTTRADADFEALTDWLRGEGLVIFSNEHERAYRARIAGPVEFGKLSNSLKMATIPFYVQPYKEQFPKEVLLTKTGTSGTITNPGCVESRPIITVDYEGNIEIEIGGYSMQFTGLTDKIIVDCDAEIITNEDGTIWEGTYSGDFWRIPTGDSTITMSESGCTLTIQPEWRWV